MIGKNVHFIGIGGVGMAGLAVLLKAEGSDVTGCDLHATARTRWLESLGIPVAVGHSPEHVRDADIAVATPAVHPDNPERMAAKRVITRGELLADLVSSRESIAVCGSHGKTTTSTFIAKLLLALGERVSWAIGGETGDFPVAGANGGVLVVEADESDGTLALYHATTLVVTNCEYDHPDHFKTPADYFACFDAARRNARYVIEAEEVWNCFLSTGTVPPTPMGTVPPTHMGTVPMSLGGSLQKIAKFAFFEQLPEHNKKNALAAVAVALQRGHSPEAIAKVLPGVVSVLPDRRFQMLAPGVYTDYAHHPTEMKCAVSMARRICRGALRVLFQPHRYSRTKALVHDFPAAFVEADEVVLCPTYAAFESPVEGGDIADLYAECRRGQSPRILLARSCAEAWEHARNSMGEGDITLLLGAGDIIGLAPQVEFDMAHPGESHRNVRRILIGAGSNTWRSDLKLDVEYVKTASPAGRPGASLGIPWMAGIPGTIGGWVKMNAGAFGHSISEVISRVKVDGEWRAAADCGFGYRTSAIIGEIEDIELDSANYAAAKADTTDYLARRRRFPSGTKGSVFKNPPGDYAGRLLEEAGCKGLRVGGAYVWEDHANVIVSGPDATPSDFLALARLMRERVRFRFGVVLEPEVKGLEP